MTMNRRSMVARLLAAATASLSPATLMAQQDFTATARNSAARLWPALIRIESVRSVKQLQNTLAQYIHHGLWDEAGALFTKEGSFRRGSEVRGPKAIASLLREEIGRSQDGLARGELHAQLVASPVIILGPTGDNATGRWHDIVMTGGSQEPAAWAGGVWITDYQRTGGVWKIASMRYYPTFAGPYEQGFRNIAPDLKEVPYLYTPEMAGTPETMTVGPAPAPPDGLTLDEILVRIARLDAEVAARNLQHMFGYYLDRKMWDDVADLFGDDGMLVVGKATPASGSAAIWRQLEAEFGSSGLAVGELNDHPQFNLTVDVDRDGRSATVRGQELGMRGTRDGKATWSLSTFSTRIVRRAGVWKIGEMRIDREMKASYSLGWSESDLLPTMTTGERIIAPFPPHPVTGKSVKLAPGLRSRSTSPSSSGATSDLHPLTLSAAETALSRAAAHDAIENISGTFGDYLNDSRWWELSRLFTENGERVSPGAGWYRGRERIFAMQMARNGPPRRPRTFIPIHLRMQPVIHVAEDARSARMHTRLLQFNSAWEAQGSLSAGYYDDVLILEDGVWRFSANEIRHTWLTRNLNEGWAGVPDNLGRDNARSPDALIKAMPPDRPIDGLSYPAFPQVDTVRFHYRNPVSGRIPPGFRGD